MRVSGVTYNSVVDGPGLRNVVFFHGCPYSCPGCHNQETQLPNSSFLYPEWFQHKKKVESDGGRCVWRARSPEFLLAEMMKRTSDQAFQRLTLSGGEPLDQLWKRNSKGDWVMDDGIVRFVQAYRTECKQRGVRPHVMIYSGNTVEHLLHGPVPEMYQGLTLDRWVDANRQLLSLCDVLVDGPYDHHKRVDDRGGVHYGSENQRYIDLKKTLKSNTTVLAKL